MNDDKSPVDKLNDTLYSRTGYHAPEDARSPVRDTDTTEVDSNWKTPNLDDMLKDRRAPDPKPLKMQRFFMFSILFFVGAFLLAAYVYIGGGNFVSTKNVDILVTGPAVIEAGQPLVLTATVENSNNAELESANLSIQYPEGTRQADDPTLALTRDHADLGIVKAGGESVETFRSVLFGQKGEVKQLKLTLEYTIKGSRTSFFKTKTYEITIGDTPVAIGIEKPDSVTSGVPFTTRIIIAANTTDVLKNVVVRAEYPYGFHADSSSPDAAASDNVWTMGDLAPGDKKTITLKGTITGVDQDERTFRFYAGVADPGSPTILKNPLVSTTETFALARPTVGLLVSLNGDNDGDYVAPMGTPVTATLKYQNNGTEKLSNTQIVLKLTGSALDKSSVKADGFGFYDSANDQVVWQGATLAGLNNLAPGDSGEVQVSFSSLKILPAGKNQTIDLKASISGIPGGVSSADPIQTSVSRSVKVSSTANLSGKVLYSRGPFRNTGPIPPKAEATTTYTVVFDLGNTQNNVSSGVLTAKLGPNVKWVASGDDAANLTTYDPASNMVTWNVGTLESGAGFSKPMRESAFQISIRPSIGQVGTVPTLVSGISFSGTDSFTNLPVTASMGNLSTRLTSDPAFVQGDDTVVK
jgi:hypothetical protein